MPSLDPAWLDAQYNNRARIPEHPVIFERWAAASRLARERSSCHLDLRYGDAGGETLDVFPASAAGAPVLVFFHGGWWRSLDKRDHSFVAPAFVDAGAMVVVPNYDLCPNVDLVTLVMQAVNAVAWVHRNAARYGGDPQRIVVAGHSAGGHLAAMLLCCDWPAVGSDLPAGLVSSALAISGVYDLEPIRHTPFLQNDLRLSAADVERLSPARLPAPRGPLCAVVGGDESEAFLAQNDLIRAAWGAASLPVCERLAGCHHLDVLRELADPSAGLHLLAPELLACAVLRTLNEGRSPEREFYAVVR